MKLRSLRVLDFDIENRPLAYLGPEYTTAEITAIAACWVDKPKSMKCWLLGVDSYKEMLEGFRAMYDQADMVTGHYIRAHDLPIINGAMLESGLPKLAEKLTSDTKCDLVKHHYLSASQENLAAALGVRKLKQHVINAEWRTANRLTPEGIKLTARRAIGDVIQHMAMRKVLIERDLLGSPKMWRP